VNDKRDSTRVPARLCVLDALEGHKTEVEGDISLGGARARLPFIPAVLKVRVQLHQGLIIPGEIFKVRPAREGGADVIIRFADLTLETERALARFIDDFEISKEHPLPPKPEDGGS